MWIKNSKKLTIQKVKKKIKFFDSCNGHLVKTHQHNNPYSFQIHWRETSEASCSRWSCFETLHWHRDDRHRSSRFQLAWAFSHNRSVSWNQAAVRLAFAVKETAGTYFRGWQSHAVGRLVLANLVANTDRDLVRSIRRTVVALVSGFETLNSLLSLDGFRTKSWKRSQIALDSQMNLIVVIRIVNQSNYLPWII